MANFIDGWSKFFNIFDFFQFLLPGLVLLIGLSLILVGVNQPVFAKLVQDTLPENDWLLGGAVVILAYVLGLLVAWPGQKLAQLFYSRLDGNDIVLPPPTATPSGTTARDWAAGRPFTYLQAWVILRESKDKQSYDFCYYIWGLEAMFRSLAVSFIVLGIGFWFYDLLPGRRDNAVLLGVFLALAVLMLWGARGYYGRLVDDLSLSARWKTKSDSGKR